MPSEGPTKAKLTINVSIDEALRIRILELGISPATVAKAALRAEVKRRERQMVLQEIRRVDPTVTASDLKTSFVKIRNLKKMASMQQPSIDVESLTR